MVNVAIFLIVMDSLTLPDVVREARGAATGGDVVEDNLGHYVMVVVVVDDVVAVVDDVVGDDCQ